MNKTHQNRLAAQYQAVIVSAHEALGLAATDRARVLRRLRAQNQRVRRRDYFHPTEREAAQRALTGLAAAVDLTPATVDGGR